MIAWPSRRRGLDPREPKCTQIKRIDESIDRTNRIDLIDEVIEAFGQQRRLPTIHPLNEALHPIPRQPRGNTSAKCQNLSLGSRGSWVVIKTRCLTASKLRARYTRSRMPPQAGQYPATSEGELGYGFSRHPSF